MEQNNSSQKFNDMFWDDFSLIMSKIYAPNSMCFNLEICKRDTDLFNVLRVITI